MQALLRSAGRGLDLALYALAVGAVIILIAVVASVSFEVVMRYVFGRPTRWVVEFSEYSLIYLAFLAGGWVLKEEGHVKVEMLVELLPAGTQLALHRATSAVGAIVCGLFTWVSAQLTLDLYRSGEIMFKSVQVQKWAIMAVIPLGLLLLSLQFLRRAFGDGPRPGSVGF